MDIYFEGLKEGEDMVSALGREQAERLERAAVLALEKEGLDAKTIEACQVSLSVVGEDEIHSLNREYRGVDRPTDVLSFPQFEGLEDLENVPSHEEICLGDVVICDEAVRRQAEEYGHSYNRELTYLFLHSILHLLGYDHMAEEEKRAMRAREEEIMGELSLKR